MSEANPRDRAEQALRNANKAAKNGDLKDAQHWNKVAREQVEIAERLGALPPPADDGAAEEARRAELRRRIAMFVDAANDCEKWEEEAAIHYAALANGLDAEPLRPHPAGKLSENEYLDAIARGEEAP
jgi:hypothetical protein